MVGVVGLYRWRCKAPGAVKNGKYSGTLLERATRVGESPVHEMLLTAWVRNLSRAGHEKSCLNLGGPPSKAKYTIATDSE